MQICRLKKSLAGVRNAVATAAVVKTNGAASVATANPNLRGGASTPGRMTARSLIASNEDEDYFDAMNHKWLELNEDTLLQLNCNDPNVASSSSIKVRLASDPPDWYREKEAVALGIIHI